MLNEVTAARLPFGPLTRSSTQVCSTISDLAICDTRVTRPLKSHRSLIQIVCPCICLADCCALTLYTPQADEPVLHQVPPRLCRQGQTRLEASNNNTIYVLFIIISPQILEMIIIMDIFGHFFLTCRRHSMDVIGIVRRRALRAPRSRTSAVQVSRLSAMIAGYY